METFQLNTRTLAFNFIHFLNPNKITIGNFIKGSKRTRKDLRAKLYIETEKQKDMW